MKLRLVMLADIRMDRTIYRDGSVPIEPYERRMLEAELRKAMEARREIIMPALPLSTVPGTYNREFYATVLDEQPSISEYPSGWSYSGPRNGVSNAPFKKRCLLGDIIVSPFNASSGYGDYESSVVTVPANGPTYSPSVHRLVDVNWFSRNGAWYQDDIVYNGQRFHGQFTSIYTTWSYEMDKHPLQLGWEPDMLSSIVAIEKKVDDALVQECLSAANSGTLDLLTSIAELPDTIKSISDVMQSMIKIITDTKKRKFNLTARNERAKEKLALRRKSLDSEIAQLLEQIAVLERRGRIVTDRPEQREIRRQLQKLRRKRRRLQQKVRDIKLELAKFSEELTTAIANLWMNYRYNIETNKMMIEDIINSFDQYGREFARWREKSTFEVEMPSFDEWTFKGEAQLIHRVFIKRSFKAEDLIGRLNQILRANFTVTMWELITRSFVVDWFFTIGDAISALSYNNSYHVQEGSCYSWTLELKGRYEHPSGASVGINYKHYDRIVIDPRSSIGLYFVPDWSPYRQLDTMAMLWPKLRTVVSNQIRELDKLTYKGK